MLTCIPCPGTKGLIKEITNHIKSMSSKAARMRQRRKPKGARESAVMESTEGSGEESDEWVAEPEIGVLITLVPLPSGGGNTLKKIRFSQEIFDAYGAQKWWSENYDKIMDLYSIPADQSSPTPSRSDADQCSIESAQEQQLMDPMSSTTGSSGNSSDVWTHTSQALVGEISEITGAEDQARGSKDSEWVVEEEPGVYLTVHALPDGCEELLRVELSREKFGEVKARVWWEENKARLHKQYTMAI